MYRKEVNERSPLRVFERSIHGGLGRGNLGVVMSRAGIGKSAFLIDIGLDDLMRDRRVLHVAVNDSVERVRAFYDEMFVELAKSTHLEHPDEVRYMVERNRHIHSYKDVQFSVDRLVTVVRFLKEHADFPLDAVIVDNFPFASTTTEEVGVVKNLAKEMNCEIWMSALSHRDSEKNDMGFPDPLTKHDEFLSVKIYLKTEGDGIRLKLLKDHDNEDLSELMLDLDPTTLLLKDRQPAS